ncbi:MAG: 50S ribosomal protein L10 [Phycisphaerales bacterium]|nr:50S ribosomal protein L10 [Phycisphaerales bacterium]
MSKPIKEMMIREYRSRFDGLSQALLVDIRGIEANENNSLRLGLHAQNIRVTVLRNNLARDAFNGTDLEGLIPAIDGPAALCYGGESVVDVAREIVAWAKKVEHLDLKGAILDGELFEGEAGVKRLSTFPTREEAQAKVVQLMLSPASNLVGASLAPGGNIMGIVKEIQERLENGKTIEKTA